MTIRIGNCSGFYGDRLSAFREMLEGGPLDYLTGDYLAELTMLILGKDTVKDPGLGYARTFVKQAEDALGLALERDVKVVVNAGGLNPRGLADKLREVATGLGLDPKIAHVEGDDLRDQVADLGLLHETYGNPMTANAYLGAFGIASALERGADLVVTGRVTDASVVVGPAIAHFGWTPESYDALAGAVVAGHIIECGTQATGGNFSGFVDLMSTGAISGGQPLGFPIAELSEDGSMVITKHDGTGGAVTVDTVTAQLVYEIQSTRYLNPDVTVDLTSLRLEQAGPDRVAVTGVTGSPPPEQLKVCLNYFAGFRNSAEFVVTGLDCEAKVEWVKAQVESALGSDRPAKVVWSGIGPVQEDADTEEGASLLLRVTAFDPSADKVGKALTAPIIELALGSYPGFSVTRMPGPGTAYGVYRPAYVPRGAVRHTVVHHDGTTEVIDDPVSASAPVDPAAGQRPSPYPAPTDTLTRRLPLGTFVHGRSGDKGGDANIGLWVKNDGHPRYAERVTWLTKFMSQRRVRELIPEAADLDIEVYVLPNLGGVNVLIHGLLDEGVAATARFDPQAKGLAEWIRSRLVNIEGNVL
ncbi:acyclic terpene utilization AtuA family protein [Nocardioides bizhenqiangii]|uniref:Acyclic terpene utilization AtuA family protein n=1 Tax=Nocardioides bizhenqiangii TaxID=3095076 RepID=A0ABZ0ZQZ5_9ACTN|nr:MULTISPECIES: acyclic terpene utilization AtuA family protein [unclassified Nocardioides]MDZ5619257.1 acyclic terpene utilization AtuA family protein [Nocardioides sp. HM23]WQQ26720.1 acyclic terpene utilization AtuA family protein [Nocardioides sp. HM61]